MATRRFASESPGDRPAECLDAASKRPSGSSGSRRTLTPSGFS